MILPEYRHLTIISPVGSAVLLETDAPSKQKSRFLQFLSLFLLTNFTIFSS